MHRDRFPGLADGWARLDGPAGTQMVDDAIEAMAGWMRSGDGANHGGAFQAAIASIASSTICVPAGPSSRAQPSARPGKRSRCMCG